MIDKYRIDIMWRQEYSGLMQERDSVHPFWLQREDEGPQNVLSFPTRQRHADNLEKIPERTAIDLIESFIETLTVLPQVQSAITNFHFRTQRSTKRDEAPYIDFVKLPWAYSFSFYAGEDARSLTVKRRLLPDKPQPILQEEAVTLACSVDPASHAELTYCSTAYERDGNPGVVERSQNNASALSRIKRFLATL